MSARLSLPLNQQRHSNVAVVKLAKKGRAGGKLEIACYKNKVVAFRGGVEDKLDEVLQIDRIFTSVSKGMFASEDDMKKVLGSDFDVSDPNAVILHILRNGELQVAQHERSVECEQTMKDVCTLISEKCVHPTTRRPYSVTMIEQAVRSLGVSIRTDQPPKKQALLCIKQLCETQVIPIQRAMMRLKVRVPPQGADSFIQTLQQSVDDRITADEVQTTAEYIDFQIPPEAFRGVEELCRAQYDMSVQVVSTAVLQTDEDAGLLDMMAEDVAMVPPPTSAGPSAPASEPQPTSAPATSVHELLDRHGCSAATIESVVAMGFDTIGGVRKITERDFARIGIDLGSQQQALAAAVEASKQEAQTSIKAKAAKDAKKAVKAQDDASVEKPTRGKRGGKTKKGRRHNEDSGSGSEAPVTIPSDSSSDGGKRKKKAKKPKAKPKPSQPDPAPVAEKEQSGTDSDEVLSGKARKKLEMKKLKEQLEQLKNTDPSDPNFFSSDEDEYKEFYQ